MSAMPLSALLCAIVLTSSVMADEAGSPAVPVNAAAVANPLAAHVRIPEGTEVPLVFIDNLSSATNTEGDRFTLRVDADVKVGGMVAIPAGSIAVGTVTSAHKRGHMGKAGDLNIALDHVSVGDDRVRLRGNKGKEGDAKTGTTVALTVLFGPIGLLKRGHDVDIKAGTPMMAFVDQSTDIAATR